MENWEGYLWNETGNQQFCFGPVKFAMPISQASRDVEYIVWYIHIWLKKKTSGNKNLTLREGPKMERKTRKVWKHGRGESVSRIGVNHLCWKLLRGIIG